MHILITDSGVGGLSVVAYAERFVRTHGFDQPIRLTFANAAPANDYGYNSMPSREIKVQTFDRFLSNVAERYRPDMIYVACNTLSVLLADTDYFQNAVIPVGGIVETGVALLLRELRADSRSAAMIFATQTTIDAGTYPRLLENGGVDPSRIITQACPGLADIISEDRQGARAAAEIRRWVDVAVAKMTGQSLPVVVCLACTHYGYRKALFADALSRAGVAAKIINPNESAVDDLFGSREDLHAGANRNVPVDVVTRYAIPPAAVEALTWFLTDISPRTVAALAAFVQAPDLF